MEEKQQEQERLGVAKERLINIVAAYAEDYEEIRQLLRAWYDLRMTDFQTLREELKSDIRGVGDLVEKTNHNVQALAEMVGGMMEDITIIKDNVEFLKGGMKKKVDAEEFEILERRVSLLERKKAVA